MIVCCDNYKYAASTKLIHVDGGALYSFTIAVMLTFFKSKYFFLYFGNKEIYRVKNAQKSLVKTHGSWRTILIELPDL